MPTPIETIIIAPTPDMPRDVYIECYRKAYFMKLMERLPDGRVLWDENMTSDFSEGLAGIEYTAFTMGLIKVEFELPKAFVEKNFS